MVNQSVRFASYLPFTIHLSKTLTTLDWFYYFNFSRNSTRVFYYLLYINCRISRYIRRNVSAPRHSKDIFMECFENGTIISYVSDGGADVNDEIQTIFAARVCQEEKTTHANALCK